MGLDIFYKPTFTFHDAHEQKREVILREVKPVKLTGCQL